MNLVVKITPNEKGNPPGKLADAELHFIDGELDGLKLIGFGVWERRSGDGRNVTFPARQYAVNGERRSFALLRPIAGLLRPIGGRSAEERIRELVIQTYAEHEQGCDFVTPATGQATSVVVKITPNEKGNPPGKLADAELHFIDGELDGLRLIGFAIWERRSGDGRNVTFPARQYAVNGERRSFALLRPIADQSAQNRLRDLVLQAYAEHEQETAEPAR
jgi:hypothetical protein